MHMETELFVDGRLSSCSSNPFMIPSLVREDSVEKHSSIRLSCVKRK